MPLNKFYIFWRIIRIDFDSIKVKIVWSTETANIFPFKMLNGTYFNLLNYIISGDL